MKKAIVALGLALSLIIGNIAVYADTKAETIPVEPVFETTESIDFSSLKDDNAELESTVEINFMKDFVDVSNKKYSLIINGHVVYDDYFENIPGGGKTKSSYLYSDKGIVIIPLFFASQMMGAELKEKTDNTVTFEKDGKQFTFELGSDSYKENGVSKKLTHAVVNNDGMWGAAFYDLAYMYNLIFRVDYSPSVRAFDKTLAINGRKDYVHVQVIAWDRDMKLFKRSNPEVKKFIKNIDSWYDLRQNRINDVYASKLDYILLDTKTKKDFHAVENKNRDSLTVTSDNKWLNGFGYIIKNKQITHDIFGNVNMGSTYSWYSNKGAKYKNGEDKAFVDGKTFKEADMYGFHSLKSNVMTVYVNN